MVMDSPSIFNSSTGYRLSRIDNFRLLQSHLEKHIEYHRADPRQRFVSVSQAFDCEEEAYVSRFIEAPHSRDPLSITSEMFTYIMTYLQIMPSFIELVFPFGLQHYAQAFHFCGFTAANRLSRTDRGLQIPSLRRTGLHVELCYSLKSVERTPDPNNPWSIRQCSIHHRFDLESEQATWIVVKGNSLIQDLIKGEAVNGHRSHNERHQDGSSPFSNTLRVHALLAAWAGENWQWYINDLEEKLQSVTRATVTVPIQVGGPAIGVRPSKSRRSLPLSTKRKWSMRTLSRSMKRSLSWSTVWSDRSTITGDKHPPTIGEDVDLTDEPIEEDFSFRDLQSCQFIQEKASEILLVLKSNINILDSLRSNYLAVLDQLESESMFRSSDKTATLGFSQSLVDITKKTNMQQSRVETLLQLIGERKSIVSPA